MFLGHPKKTEKCLTVQGECGNIEIGGKRVLFILLVFG